jgi:hypothetical protein
LQIEKAEVEKSEMSSIMKDQNLSFTSMKLPELQVCFLLVHVVYTDFCVNLVINCRALWKSLGWIPLGLKLFY